MRIRPAWLAWMVFSLVVSSASAQPKAKPLTPKTPSAAPAKPVPPAAGAKRRAPPRVSFSFEDGGSGRLGARVTEMSEELRAYFRAGKDEGVLVQKVEPNTPAARAGLKVGDVITRVGQEPMESPSDVARALSDKKNGEVVPVHVVREKRALEFKVKLDTDPSDSDGFSFDFSIGDLEGLFKAFPPSGGSKRFFKQWQWKWPSDDQSGDPNTDPDRIEKRRKELEKRLEELDKKGGSARPKTKT